MPELSQYEKQRLKNIEENKKILASLGLERCEFPPPKPAHFVKKTNAQRKQGVKRKRPDAAAPKDYSPWVGSGYMTRSRRSQRLEGKDACQYQELDFKQLEDGDDDDDDYEEEKKPIRAPRNRENVFGEIPGSSVGACWSTRLACCVDGVHRPTVAGIHGNDSEGCYSLALSGGYEDDLDYGVCFTYTGEGGRDLKGTKMKPKNLRTAPQSKNQVLSRGNLALSRNVENRRPIRVIRGYKLKSAYAPEEGYRYDGLYTVEKFWEARGLSGFLVYKFALKRCDDQAPPPWEQDETDGSGSEETCPDVENIGCELDSVV